MEWKSIVSGKRSCIFGALALVFGVAFFFLGWYAAARLVNLLILLGAIFLCVILLAWSAVLSLLALVYGIISLVRSERSRLAIIGIALAVSALTVVVCFFRMDML